jgi:hypothetical protein
VALYHRGLVRSERAARGCFAGLTASVFAAAILGACNAILGNHLDTGRALDAGDDGAGCEDSGGKSPDDAAPADATLNLLSNPSFENGVGGCGTGWTAFGILTFVRSSVAHTGASSCMMCSSDAFELGPATALPVDAGESYYGEAWVHGAPPSSDIAAGIEFTDYYPDGAPYYNASPNAPALADDAGWTLIEYVLPVTPGTTKRQFGVHGTVTTGAGCLLVDDVALYKQ